MRSGILDVISPRVRRSLSKLGADISLARRKRGLTEHMMAERLGVARGTYQRVEQGDPSVAMGVYAMTLLVLGAGTPLADLADPQTDNAGLAFDAARVPKRVRVRRQAHAD
jgi:transcriptional regulator with XRE-family HTH domain